MTWAWPLKGSRVALRTDIEVVGLGRVSAGRTGTVVRVEIGKSDVRCWVQLDEGGPTLGFNEGELVTLVP